jgi:hypothetical protein
MDEERKISDALSNAGQPPGSEELEEAGKVPPSSFLNPTPGLPAGGAPPASTMSGMNTLRNAATSASQDLTKSLVPKPRTWAEDLRYRTQNMNRDELLSSDVLWGKARDLSAAKQISFTQAYKILADGLLANKGKLVSDEELQDVMMQAIKYGIR